MILDFKFLKTISAEWRRQVRKEFNMMNRASHLANNNGNECHRVLRLYGKMCLRRPIHIRLKHSNAPAIFDNQYTTNPDKLGKN